jgi:hypothetical protein
MGHQPRAADGRAPHVGMADRTGAGAAPRHGRPDRGSRTGAAGPGGRTRGSRTGATGPGQPDRGSRTGQPDRAARPGAAGPGRAPHLGMAGQTGAAGPGSRTGWPDRGGRTRGDRRGHGQSHVRRCAGYSVPARWCRGPAESAGSRGNPHRRTSPGTMFAASRRGSALTLLPGMRLGGPPPRIRPVRRPARRQEAMSCNPGSGKAPCRGQ